ncbi:DUF4280 domain-containing protein [Paenibacillus montaniterrae]|uniref:DUF4280 domain-containing protein n=1 Tax=Paenibacillus montaniterrae TaxID=429341 RepID=UPI001FE461ED|nr:DUF4280 domain-containing protein [Paenibacillus montaniterrae]
MITIGQLVCGGASLQCSFGTAPNVLTVAPSKGVLTGLPAATIMDHIPMANIAPFALCNSMSNPAVASATAAKFGTLTPMPCVPVTSAPWIPGSPTVLIGNLPALNSNSKCMCAYGGVISITTPGQFTVQVP